jgi:FAD/FMN-containing dehydrogenase
MGLTGIIVRACFRMLRVESASIRQRTLIARNIEHAIELFEQTLGWTYSVAWIDCLAGGRNLGRSVVILGEHALPDELPAAARATPFARTARRQKTMPIDLPGFVLNRLTVRAFNEFYYRAHRAGETVVDYDPYFYPLDAILEWNRIYGKRGFMQYQCVLPLAESGRGMTRLLEEIRRTGNASFLAVLKRMGPPSVGMLSFPIEGYTLALDFPFSPTAMLLLDRLDRITGEHGGRIYLAKDSRTSPALLARGYPRLGEFLALRQHTNAGPHFTSLLSHRLGL